MINLQELAYKFNEELGADNFVVYLNTDVYNEDIGDRNAVIMSASRVPMGYTEEELDAESMIVTLVFDLPVDTYGKDLIARDIALEIITEKLLGRQEFNNVAGYTVTTFFEQQPPSDPYTDEGRITQQIVVSGTCLVQNVECNAIVGNTVKVYLDDVELVKVAHSSSMQYGSDNNIPLSSGSVQAELENISKICTKALTFIYTGKDVENTLIAIAEGVVDNINEVHTYKVNYGNGIIVEKNVKILSVTVIDEPGVYLKYSVNLQTVN